jgi:hypothetical protein
LLENASLDQPFRPEVKDGGYVVAAIVCVFGHLTALAMTFQREPSGFQGKALGEFQALLHHVDPCAIWVAAPAAALAHYTTPRAGSQSGSGPYLSSGAMRTRF